MAHAVEVSKLGPALGASASRVASLDFAAVQHSNKAKPAGVKPVYANGDEVGCHWEIQGENGDFSLFTQDRRLQFCHS
jgi:hypothetical protein